MFIGCVQAGLQQIVEDQQKMISHLEAELRKSTLANSALESTKVFLPTSDLIPFCQITTQCQVACIMLIKRCLLCSTSFKIYFQQILSPLTVFLP